MAFPKRIARSKVLHSGHRLDGNNSEQLRAEMLIYDVTLVLSPAVHWPTLAAIRSHLRLTLLICLSLSALGQLLVGSLGHFKTYAT